MSQTYQHVVSYLFNDQAREYTFELDQPALPVHEAALHLLQLHFGDAENGLIMPSADTSPAAVLDQTQLLGIRAIHSRLIG